MEPIGYLTKLKVLQTLTISSMALFGDIEHETRDNPNPAKHKHQRSNPAKLLPQSLQQLTILHHDIYLDGPIRQLLHDPMVASLDRFILMNCRKERWIAKDGIEDHKLNQMRLYQVPVDAQSWVFWRWRREAEEQLPIWQCKAVQATLDRVRKDMGL